MKQETDITRYVEPIFRYCFHRLSRRQDAEDLAGEILLHILDGLRKYEIDALDAWVWRVARNRYARFIRENKRRAEYEYCVSEEAFFDVLDEDTSVLLPDEDVQDLAENEIFRCLHTLAEGYRTVLVEYYIMGKSVKEIAERLALPQTTIKWRLNAGREKLRKRIGEINMEKIYNRINWSTTCCNGSMNSNRYLGTQIARAICQAAYENPLTVEEISIATGIPAMCIEDELPRLLYGDAVRKIAKDRYATDFIVLRLSDKARMEKNFAPIVADVADCYSRLFAENTEKVRALGFTGCDRGMEKLGYIALPASLRKEIDIVTGELKLQSGPYPIRQDGGNGWFIIEETEDEREIGAKYGAGCNITDGSDYLYYYWLAPYFDTNIYHNCGTRLIAARNAMRNSISGDVPDGIFSEDELTGLIASNLMIRTDRGLQFHFPCFTAAQFDAFRTLFAPDAKLHTALSELVKKIHGEFVSFVPARLHSQINQWVRCYAHQIVGFTAQELIARGVLETPDAEVPLTNGVFYVSGDYVSDI